jgi:hypothetical protein
MRLIAASLPIERKVAAKALENGNYSRIDKKCGPKLCQVRKND